MRKQEKEEEEGGERSKTKKITLRDNGHFPSVHCFPEIRGRKTLGEERLSRVP
jgi:hypothetical protein